MKTYTYYEAVEYLVNHGISCDPNIGNEGEYVGDLLDDMIDEWDEYQDAVYYEGTLDSIISLAKDYLKEEDD